jgi:hypothetical protein
MLPLVTAENVAIAHFGAETNKTDAIIRKVKKNCEKRVAYERQKATCLSSRSRANDVTAAFFSRRASRDPATFVSFSLMQWFCAIGAITCVGFWTESINVGLLKTSHYTSTKRECERSTATS